MTAQKYILKSIHDGCCFEVDHHVIATSHLLSNLCALSSATENPICLDCPSTSLDMFIKLIKTYKPDSLLRNLSYMQFLFKGYNDDQLIEFFRDICFLDSDTALNSIVDMFLSQMSKLKLEEFNEYMGIENDFTDAEREWMAKYQLEYLISMNLPESPLQFPLNSGSFYALNSRFASPMNVLLARICERANYSVTHKLTRVCRTLKNECDRYPIRVGAVAILQGETSIRVATDEHYTSNRIVLTSKNINEIFNIFAKRKVAVQSDTLCIWYDSVICGPNTFSLEWIAPQNENTQIRITFHESKTSLDYFEPTKCPFNRILCYCHKIKNEVSLEYLYSKLIAKDFSKEIELITPEDLFFSSRYTRLLKKAGAVKFHKFVWAEEKPYFDAFKNFVVNYMELDGCLVFRCPPSNNIPKNIIFRDTFYLMPCCTVSDALQYL